MFEGALIAANVVVASAGLADSTSRDPSPAPVVVDFEADPTSVWWVAGLEDVVARALGSARDVELRDKIDPERCPTRETRCLVDGYRADGVAVIVLGRLEGQSRLAWEIYEGESGKRALDGILPVADVSFATLRRRIGTEIVRPIVKQDGLLDRRTMAAAGQPPLVLAPPPEPSARLPWLLASAAIAWLTSPIVLLVALAGTRALRRRERPRSWRWSLLLACALASLAIAQASFDARSALVAVTETPGAPLAIAGSIVAGMLWGAYVLSIAGWVFAPVHGLGKIRHDALWPLLRSWLALAALRAAGLSLLHAPVLFVAWRASEALVLPARTSLALVLPAAGLVACFWLLSLVDNLSVYLDIALVDGPATERNPWHATIKRYLRGYLRRNVVAVGDALVERALFLPSAITGVTSYGGGFARPRILVGERAREVALGELPDEEELPDRTVNPEELPPGVIVPSLREREDPAQLARADEQRRALAHAPPRPRAPAPRRLGANATLLGWVVPTAPDEGLPLISETVDDFSVVKRLLTAHYAAFEKHVDGDEVDDTDPRQKDFLFGALLRELGVAARRDTLLSTIRWSVELASARTPAIRRLLVRPPIALYQRFLAGPAAKVGDAYAALNTGFHHLIQYLCFLRGTDETLLTARADEPRLVKASHAMLVALAGEPPKGGENHLFRATPRSRVAWLSRFFYAPIAGGVRWARVLGAVALAAVATVFVVRSVRDAVAYHPTYVARIEAQTAPVDEGDSTR